MCAQMRRHPSDLHTLLSLRPHFLFSFLGPESIYVMFSSLDSPSPGLARSGSHRSRGYSEVKARIFCGSTRSLSSPSRDYLLKEMR